jgi:hypothetical protein
MRLLFVGVLAFGVLFVQPKPNFSGTWTLATSDSPAAAAGVKAVVVVLTQTDSTLRLKNGDQTLVFPLDGSETTMKVPGPTGPRDLRLRTRWEGAQLVVEQRTATTSINTSVTLSEDGNELTVETTVQTPQEEHREKQLFKKSKQVGGDRSLWFVKYIIALLHL